MKTKSLMILMLAAAATLEAGLASAATVTVAALKDAVIFGTSAGADTGNASGNGPGLFAGADGSSNRMRSPIAFDIASANIPSNATINSVTMTLYLGQVAGAGGGSGGIYPSRTLRLYDVLQNWTEGTNGLATSTTIGGQGQGYAKTTGDTTWDYASYNSSDPTTGKWNAAGTNLHGGNVASVESADSTFTSFKTLNAPFTWSSAGMASDVQGWVSGGTPNNGWMLQSDLETSPTSFLGFWSKDGAAANSNPAIAPALTITYSVPEPTGLSLIGIGMGAMLLRKRRTI